MYKPTYIPTYLHICIHTYIHICMHACIYTYIHTHTYIYTYIHTYIHTCLLLISMLWHRQANFESKGDKLSSSAECRIWTQGLRHQVDSRLDASWQTNWAIEHQAKKTWTRQPVPMISEHSAHSTPLPVVVLTWVCWYTCLLLISMFWHRQAIYESKRDKLSSSAECRIRTQGLRHQIASRLNARWQSNWAIEDQAKNLWSARIQPNRPHCRLAFAPRFGDMHVCCCWCRCCGTGKWFTNRKETSCLPLLNAEFEP